MDAVTLAAASAAARKKYVARGSARDLFRPPTTPGKRPAMATPPTITVGANGTSTITNSTLIPYSDSRLRYPGADIITFANNAAYGVPKQQVGQASTAGATNMTRARFVYEGQTFEWRTFSNSGALYRISINGQPTTDSWVGIGSDSVDRLIKVDLGARGIYDVMIELWHGYFGGVRIGPTDALTPSPIPNRLRMIVLGDSYTDGQSQPQNCVGYLPRLGELLGIEDIWSRGIGGTGYLTATTYRSRLAPDVVPHNPDVLLVQGSINDRNTYASQPGLLTAEINALTAQVRSALPNTLLVATSPLFAKAPDPNMVTISAEEKAAWQALGVPYIDGSNWNTGTGDTVTPTGAGTGDFNCSADHVHPSAVGYDHLAFNLAAALGPILRDGGATAGALIR